MKTAISLPDSLYIEAEKVANTLGIPRSQLFAKALQEFIDHHKRENITEKLNRVYSKEKNRSDINIEYTGIEALRDFTQNDSW